MLRIDDAERRRRLAVRHGLAPEAVASGPAGAARRVVALHCTDPATVYLSVRARTGGAVTAAQVDESLYERRELVRMLAMRRTVFAVPAESVPVVHAAVGVRLAAEQRARLLRLVAQSGVTDDPAAWLADVERSVLSALAGLGGTATAAELSAAEPRLKTTVVMAAGKPYEATQALTSRVLLVLAAQGRIIRGRPVGSWLSQQYRWALAEHWLASGPGGGGTAADWADVPGDPAAARAELARQWLRAFGPAPLADLKWWTGWTTGQARQAAADLGAVEVILASTRGDARGGAAGQEVGVALPDDLEPTPDPGPWVALLPALDPTVMGWSARSWFLGPHATALFDRTGNAGPTVWLDGRVVGGWAQRASGEVALRLLEDTGAEAVARIESEAERTAAWLGAARVTPRFRTPVERELSA